MEWSKLYANLPDDPRVQAAEDDGGGGWLLVQSFCYVTRAESLIDGEGFIPDTQVRRFGCTPEQVDALAREKLWTRDDARRGWLLDPSIWNEDRNLSDSAEKKRRADRERIAAKRAKAKTEPDRDVSRDVSRDCRATDRATPSRDSRALDKRRREKKPPPIPPGQHPIMFALPDVKAEGEESRDGQPRDIAALIAEIRVIRPDWSTDSTMRALNDPAVTERPWPLVREATLIMARDSSSAHPGRLKCDGPWWAAARTAAARQGPPSVPTHPFEAAPDGTCVACLLPRTNQRHQDAS